MSTTHSRHSRTSDETTGVVAARHLAGDDDRSFEEPQEAPSSPPEDEDTDYPTEEPQEAPSPPPEDEDTDYPFPGDAP